MLKDFHQDLGDPTVIFEDIQSCLKLIEEERFTGRSKHIDVRGHFVRDYVDKEMINCIYCPTESMLADILTKPLPAGRIKKLREEIGLT